MRRIVYVSGVTPHCLSLPLAKSALDGARAVCASRGDTGMAAMGGLGVLVHCPGRLGAAVAVLAAEFPCGDGMFTKRTIERAKAVRHFDGIISHNLKYSRLSRYGSELKLPSLLVTDESRC
jgi:hypothetical protein